MLLDDGSAQGDPVITGQGTESVLNWENRSLSFDAVSGKFNISELNQPPSLNITAGPSSNPDPVVTTTANLSVSAEGEGNITYSWTLKNGPAAITFSDANAANPTVTFTESGSYTLTVTITDEHSQVQADLAIEVVSMPTNIDINP